MRLIAYLIQRRDGLVGFAYNTVKMKLIKRHNLMRKNSLRSAEKFGFLV